MLSLVILGLLAMPVAAHADPPDELPPADDPAAVSVSAPAVPRSPAIGPTAPATPRPGVRAPSATPAPTVTIPAVAWAEVPIRAVLGGGFLPNPLAVTYQWRVDAVPVPGATGASFTPRGSQVGAQVTVVVSATPPGSRTLFASSTSAEVRLQEFTTTPIPTIGSARVGRAVAVSIGAWGPQPTSFGYRWFRDGSPIPGAAASTYVPGVSDLGHALSVEVMPARAGFAGHPMMSGSVVVTEGQLATTPRVSVTGGATVGTTLRAAVSGAPSGSTVSYQWLRDGVAISGATGSTYVLAPTDVGHQITVSIVVSLVGYLNSGPTPSSPVGVTGKSYANCDAMHVDYPHGVMKVGATDMVAGTPRAPHPGTFVSTPLYLLNTKSDRDKDGIACEA